MRLTASSGQGQLFSVPTLARAEEGECDKQEIHGKWATAAGDPVKREPCGGPGSEPSGTLPSKSAAGRLREQEAHAVQSRFDKVTGKERGKGGNPGAPVRADHDGNPVDPAG